MTEQVLVNLTLRLLENYHQDCQDRQLAAETIRRYKSSIKHFLSYLQSRNITPQELDKSTLIEYIRERRAASVTQNTLKKDFAAINGLYDFLVFTDRIERNPVPGVRKRYLRTYKKEGDPDNDSPPKLISIQQMSLLINSVLDTRDKAILTLLAKTGVRRGELIAMDAGDMDWAQQSITLKRFRKRSNRVVFFDDESARVLRRWLTQRDSLAPELEALFVGERGERLKRNGVYSMVLKYAERMGLHDPKSQKPEDHFTPHCFRHFFTSYLLRAGMDRTYVQILRGDKRKDAIDIYHHVDLSDIRKEYLAFIPQLGL